MAAGDGQCLAGDQGQDGEDAVEAFGGPVLAAVGAEGGRGDVVLGVVDGGGQQGGRGQRPGFFEEARSGRWVRPTTPNLVAE